MNGKTTSRFSIWRLAVVVLFVSPGLASAQTQSPWAIVNATTRICPDFMTSGDILRARADAESYGYRTVKIVPDNLALETNPEAPPRAVWMTGGTLGSLHLSSIDHHAMCAVGIEQATVELIADLAGPKLLDRGYQPELRPADGGAVSWTTDSARALILRSAHHLPGIEMSYLAF